MSHNPAMMRNTAPIGSRSNIWELPRFDAGRARAGCGNRRGSIRGYRGSRRRTEALGGRLAEVITDAEPVITAIVGRRGLQRTRTEFGRAACGVFAGEFGDDGTEGSVLGE